MRFLLALSSLVTAVFAVGRTSAPAGALTVGSGRKFSTIQAAVNSLSTTSTGSQSIFILPGTYKEQVIIPARKAILKIYGYTQDTSSYTGNQVTIIHGASLKNGAPNNRLTGTVVNDAANTAFYNINIKNSYGPGAQAGALSAYNTNQGYYGVALFGYQDTLLSQIGNHIFAKCYIGGAVDTIYGQQGRAWITASDIRVNGVGAVTASGRLSGSDVSYYVIDKSSIEKTPNSSVPPGTVHLGRPWSQWGRVLVQNTVLGSIVNSAGWSVWHQGEPRTSAVTFLEYGNSGPGAAGPRASFAKKAAAPVTIQSVLGAGYAGWVDMAYLPKK
ncbi:related to pectinesterase precursor [Rhynchosporium secalis]|uniref:pectinesterase n=1 Tax=Rhynchosporium secalis TaxID=38038 RepID=A0A1E1LXQ7_RHYSE|nr:related to pectinesterase precursor [Rhynchosporium secalis]